MRRGVFWLLLVAALLLIAIVAGRPSTQHAAFDPDSSDPSGAKALLLLLEEFGASVDVGADIGDDTDVAFVIVDELTDEQRSDVQAWVDGGGRLVIADPNSPLTPFVADTFGAPFLDLDDIVEQGDCTVDALSDAVALQPRFSLEYEVPADADSCYGDGRTALVVVEQLGEGVQVSIGGPDLFTNEALGDIDNAVLAVDLLAPTDGTQVAWIERDGTVASETDSLWSLVSSPVRAALLQLVVASLFYLAYRARRLGRPLREPQPVQLAGSELVGAVGHLLQQTGDPNRVARLLRDELRRALRARLGLAADAPPELVADVVTDRFAIEAARSRRAVIDIPVTSDDDLVVLARDIEAIRQEVLHGHAPQLTR